MYDGLIALMINTSPIGREIRIIADMRPIDVSARTLRACRCRSRTALRERVEEPGQRAADLRLDVDGGRDVLHIG
jgi:hypothetical protein